MTVKRFLCVSILWAYASFCFAATPITLAAVYNLSGSQASLDTASLQGAKLAVQQINANGGVLGRTLVLQVIDGQSKATILRQAAKKYADNSKVQIAFGLSDNDMLRAFLPTYLAAGKLFVSSGATGANLTQQFPKRFFLTTFTDNIQASGGSKFIIDQLHRKKAFVLYQSNMSYARELAKYFVDAYRHAGGTILDKISIDQKLPTSLLAKFKKEPLSVIYLAAAPDKVPALIKQIREAKIKLPIVGGDSYVVNDITALPATESDSVYFTTHGYYDRNFMAPNMLAFVKLYQKQFGEKPTNIYSAVGYDAVKVIAAAISKAKSTQPAKVAATLNSMQEFPALTGELDLGKPVVNSMVTVVKIISGKASIAAVVIPQYIPKPAKYRIKKKENHKTNKV